MSPAPWDRSAPTPSLPSTSVRQPPPGESCFGAESPRTEPRSERLPAVESAPTQELPVVRRPHRPLEMAGWVVDPARLGAPAGGASRAAQRPAAEVGTPAEGFHRSMGWTGAIGAVHENDSGVDGREALLPTHPRVDYGRAGMQPVRGGRGRARGVVNPVGVDLTAGRLAEPPSDLIGVPQELLADALSWAQPACDTAAPLSIPGQHQEEASEVPKLSHLPPDRRTGPLLARHGAGLDMSGWDAGTVPNTPVPAPTARQIGDPLVAAP